METIEEKLQEFRKSLLDKDYPLGIDEVLCEIENLFEDDADIEEVIEDYLDDFYTMRDYGEKFYKVKDLVNELFYAISEDKE